MCIRDSLKIFYKDVKAKVDILFDSLKIFYKDVNAKVDGK